MGVGRQQDLVTHLSPAAVVATWLSELESTSIGDCRSKCKREDNFPLKDRATLSMRLFLDGLSDMMMREGRAAQWLYAPATPTVKREVSVIDESTCQ